MIKMPSLILSFFLMGHVSFLNASPVSQNESINKTNSVGFFKKITPEFLYGYTDFNFTSKPDQNFNHFQGYSYLSSAGADHISLGQSMTAGIYYFGVDTTVNSQYLLTPGSRTTSMQTIHNNTIFGHVVKFFTPEFYADLAGGYGHNKLITLTQIELGRIPLIAHSNNNNDNWFASLNTTYSTSLKKFLLKVNVGALYSEIISGSYNSVIPFIRRTFFIPSLTNKATLLMEHIELGYPVKPNIIPFISGGLIQITQFSNSRPIIDPATVINGSLPQLNMNKNGFRVGGGVAFTCKTITIRLEEKYYSAGGTYQSYQTLASLEYQFG